jgi:hypothetical protein
MNFDEQRFKLMQIIIHTKKKNKSSIMADERTFQWRPHYDKLNQIQLKHIKICNFHINEFLDIIK